MIIVELSDALADSGAGFEARSFHAKPDDHADDKLQWNIYVIEYTFLTIRIAPPYYSMAKANEARAKEAGENEICDELEHNNMHQHQPVHKRRNNWQLPIMPTKDYLAHLGCPSLYLYSAFLRTGCVLVDDVNVENCSIMFTP